MSWNEEEMEQLLPWDRLLKNIVWAVGIRTFWDLQHNQEIENDVDWQKNMMQIEMRVSEIETFRAIAFFIISY